MKTIHLIAFLLLLQIPAYAAGTPANQAEVCYSQCGIYELIWMDDYCWASFEFFCSMDKKDTALQMVGAWASVAGQDASFDILINAYMCVKLVDECIQPILDSCEAACSYNDLMYAPNLRVDSAYYDEGGGKLHFTLRNGGLALMPASSVAVYEAHTDTPNQQDSDFKFLKNMTVKELRPFDVRYAPEGMSFEQAFEMDWDPQKDKYSVAKIVISSSPDYVEGSTRDNIYYYTENDIPLPADLRVERPSFERMAPQTNYFLIYVPAENIGEKSLDAAVEFYIGRPTDGNLVGTQGLSLSGGDSETLVQDITFTSPSVNYVTIRIYSEGNLIYETLVYPDPQFLHVKGKITDEEGNPIAGAWISDTPPATSDFPLTSGSAQTIGSDERGNYDFPLFSREGAFTLYASKVGYFPNRTSFSFAYNSTGAFDFHAETILHRDIVLEMEPLMVSAGYPEPGAFIIETDRGRYTGPYFPNNAIPIRGPNGTISIFSSRCSPMIVNFSTPFPAGQIPAQNITCLDADKNDDYTVLPSELLVFEKEYPDEVPEFAFFDKRGDHVYVITIDKGDPYCNIYSYSLPGGEQLYKKELGSYCLQSSAFIPSYDGSQLYAAIGVPKIVKKGTNVSMGHIYSEGGQPVREWVYPKMTYNLEHATATEFLDLLAHPGFEYRGEEVEDCMLSEGRPCKGGGTGFYMRSVGIEGNRGVTACNKSDCVVTLGHTDYVELPSLPTSGFVVGNYLNKDLFVSSYEGGYYLHDGQIIWEIEDDIDYASMSPGGRYVLVGFDPYKISVFDSAGNDLSPEGIDFANTRGLEATERGLFYATTEGGKMSVYRLSTLVEPQSGTTTEGGTTSHFGFVGQLFQALVDMFNAAIEFFVSLFSGG